MNRVLIIILSCFFMLAARSVNGQGAVSYKIAGEFIYATVHLQKAGASIDSIIQSFGFENLDGISEQTSNTGWEFVDQTNDAITFKLNKNKKTKKLPSSFVVTVMLHSVANLYKVYSKKGSLSRDPVFVS